jgi:hypothetical protein
LTLAFFATERAAALVCVTSPESRRTFLVSLLGDALLHVFTAFIKRPPCCTTG